MERQAALEFLNKLMPNRIIGPNDEEDIEQLIKVVKRIVTPRVESISKEDLIKLFMSGGKPFNLDFHYRKHNFTLYRSPLRELLKENLIQQTYKDNKIISYHYSPEK